MTGLLKEALYRDASDIHLVPERSVVWVRMRRDGILYDHDKLSRQEYPAVLSVVKLMSGMDINEKRLPQDGRLRYRAGNIKLDLRTSTVPTVYGERVVMRLLKSAEDIPEVEGLGFLPDTLERFKALISNAYGLILITGPTGSGKSFTNFSVLKRLRSPEKNILTVEDPVEYEIPGISQVQVKPQIGLTFAKVLRSFLRQDPDVIMVGRSGTPKPPRSPPRPPSRGTWCWPPSTPTTRRKRCSAWRRWGWSGTTWRASLLGVLSQRLVRRLCPSCKRPAPPERERFYLEVMRQVDLEPTGTFYEPGGARSARGGGTRAGCPSTNSWW